MDLKALDKNYLVKNVSMTSVARGAGIVSGLTLDALILTYFGLGRETDAYFVALMIPFLICTTLEIQLPKVLVPVVTNGIRNEGTERTFRLLGNFITFSALLLALISLIGASTARYVFPALVPGLHPEALSLAVGLGSILFWLVLIRGLSGIAQSILFGYHHYVASSSSRVLSNVVCIIVLVAMHGEIGIYAVAVGALLGSLLSLVVMTLTAVNLGFRYRIILNPFEPALRRLGRLLFYPLSSHAFSESKVFVENYLLSFLAGGSLSALRYAYKIVDALLSVLVSSIVTTALPLVSHHAANKERDAMKQIIMDSIRLYIIITLPLCIWLIFTAKPLIVLMFERGEFTKADTALTSLIVALFTPYLLLSRISAIIQNMFYAEMDTRTPVVSVVITFVVNTVLALLLVGSIGVYAFPLAASAASLFTALAMAFIAHRAYGPLGWTQLWQFGLRSLGVAVITALGFMVGIVAGEKIISVWIIFDELMLFAVPTVLGFTSFLVAALLLRMIRGDFITTFIRRNTRPFFAQ